MEDLLARMHAGLRQGIGNSPLRARSVFHFGVETDHGCPVRAEALVDRRRISTVVRPSIHHDVGLRVTTKRATEVFVEVIFTLRYKDDPSTCAPTIFRMHRYLVS